MDDLVLWEPDVGCGRVTEYNNLTRTSRYEANHAKAPIFETPLPSEMT